MAENVGTLAIVLTATDKATAKINSVRDRIAAVHEPTRQLTTAFGRLGDATGLARISAGLGGAAAQARTLATAAVPLLATGGLAGGAAAAVSSFTSTAMQLRRGARELSMSTQDLQTFQNGARGTGRSAEEATEALQSLQTSAFDAIGGRNQGMLEWARSTTLGFRLIDQSTGRVRGAMELFEDAAEQYAKLNNNPQAQRLIRQTAGLGDAFHALARGGAAGVREMRRQGREWGTFTDEQIEAGVRLARQWARVQVTGDHLSTTIGGVLAPSLGRAMDELTKWMLANEQDLSSGIQQHFNIVAGVAGGLTGFIDGAVRSTIGWTTATEVLTAALGVRLLGALTGLNAFKLVPWVAGLLGVGGSTATAGVIAAGLGIKRLGEMRAERGTDTPEAQEERRRNFRERGRAGGFYRDAVVDPSTGFASGSAGRGAQDTETRESAAAARGRRALEEDRQRRSETGGAGMSAALIRSLDRLTEVQERLAERDRRMAAYEAGRPERLTGLATGPAGRAANDTAGPPNNAPAPDVQRQRGAEAMRFFMSPEGGGYSRPQSAALVAQIESESAFNERANHDGGIGYGILGWNNRGSRPGQGRLDGLGQMIGRDPRTATWQEQLRYISRELASTERGAGDRLRGEADAGRGADMLTRNYLRPRWQDAEATIRSRRAPYWMGQAPDAAAAPAPAAPAARPVPINPLFGPRADAGTNGQVNVVVRLVNAPRGTTASVETSGAATAEPPLIETSMNWATG